MINSGIDIAYMICKIYDPTVLSYITIIIKMPHSDDIDLITVDLAINSLALLLGLLSIYCYAKLQVLRKPPGCLIIAQQFLTLFLVLIELYEACLL